MDIVTMKYLPIPRFKIPDDNRYFKREVVLIKDELF